MMMMMMTYVAVEEGERVEAALGDGGHLPVVENGLDDDVGERAAVEVLHDDPELAVVAHEEAVHVVDEVRVLQPPHHLDLADDELLLRLTTQVHLLDGDRVARRHALRHDDRARRPVATATDVTVATSVVTFITALRYITELECGPMPNVMVALPITGGALCSTPRSLADAHYLTACSNAAKTRKRLKCAGVPQTRQQISAPMAGVHHIAGTSEDTLLLNIFF